MPTLRKGNKYLFKNIGILTIGQFGTRVITFLLVPLYTSVLTTVDYGIYDLFNNTIALLFPLLTQNIADATLRFSLDENNNSEDIWHISFKYFVRSIVVFGCLIGFALFFKGFDNTRRYFGFLFIMYICTSITTILVGFARGIEKIKETAISGVICTVVVVVSNIFFLLVLKWGLAGYFLSGILGGVVQSVYLLWSIGIWNYSRKKEIDKRIERQMLYYSRPMIVNNIAWWVNAASDRYIITILCGIAENGIYSVGYKIPTILNVFQNVFNQAWTISSVKDFDSEDKDGFFTNAYAAYNWAMFSICSMIVIMTKFLARFLYAKEFYAAWKYVPFLAMSVIFGSLSGFMGGIFAAVKETKIFAKTTAISAIVNIILNIFLVKNIGAIGAAIATLISNILVWAMRLVNLKRYIQIGIRIKRDIVAYFILLLQAILLFVSGIDTWSVTILQILLFLVAMYLFKKEMMQMMHKMKLVR